MCSQSPAQVFPLRPRLRVRHCRRGPRRLVTPGQSVATISSSKDEAKVTGKKEQPYHTILCTRYPGDDKWEREDHTSPNLRAALDRLHRATGRLKDFDKLPETVELFVQPSPCKQCENRKRGQDFCNHCAQFWTTEAADKDPEPFKTVDKEGPSSSSNQASQRRRPRSPLQRQPWLSRDSVVLKSRSPSRRRR